jgi:hypothetical protein
MKKMTDDKMQAEFRFVVDLKGSAQLSKKTIKRAVQALVLSVGLATGVASCSPAGAVSV